MNTKRKFYLLLGMQIFIVISIAFLFFSDFSLVSFFQDKEYIFVSQDKTCNLHEKNCTIALNKSQKITFSISPKTIPLMKKLTFIVSAEGIKAKKLKLSIYATNMNMGIHNFILKRKSNGLYESRGILPNCIVGNMNWNADITSSEFLENKGARFYFKTDF